MCCKKVFQCTGVKRTGVQYIGVQYTGIKYRDYRCYMQCLGEICKCVQVSSTVYMCTV